MGLIHKLNCFSVESYPTKREYLEIVKKFIGLHKAEFERFKQQRQVGT